MGFLRRCPIFRQRACSKAQRAKILFFSLSGGVTALRCTPLKKVLFHIRWNVFSSQPRETTQGCPYKEPALLEFLEVPGMDWKDSWGSRVPSGHET